MLANAVRTLTENSYHKYIQEMNLNTGYLDITTKPNIGLRILAGFIDYSVMITFHFLFTFFVGKLNVEGGYSFSGWSAVIPLFFWLIWIVGTEQTFDATIGNHIAGLKPISIQGLNTELTFGQSLKRHLFDMIDMSFFGLIGIIIIMNTEKN